MLLHVDGWLCEIKDVQIRDGLHILGSAPEGGAQVDLVLAILRARQMWAGEQSVPGLRQALGLAEDGTDDRSRVDEIDQQAHSLLTALQSASWSPDAADELTDDPQVAQILRFAATEVVPRLNGTDGEIDAVLRALDGRFIEADPPVHRCAGWSTCYRPGATSIRWIPRRCRRSWPGRPARPWPIRC